MKHAQSAIFAIADCHAEASVASASLASKEENDGPSNFGGYRFKIWQERSILRGRETMNRTLRLGAVSLACSLATLPAFGAELEYTVGGCTVTDVTVIDKAGGVTIGYSRGRGVTHVLNSAFDNLAFECHSVWNASKAGVEFQNRCTFIDKDGDRAIGTSTKASTAQKGWDWKFIGGSGKWAGISGGGQSNTVRRTPKIRAGVNTGCWEGSGTYTLAK